MASQRKTELNTGPRRPPATTPEGRENQMIALAVDCAEKQMRDGTASSQLITHYLKLGSSREKLEQEKMAHENRLLQVKRDVLESEKRTEALFQEAMDAFRSYSPSVETPQEFQ